MKKLKIEKLKVTSFITEDQGKAFGGNSFPGCSGGQYTCALFCSDTNGVHGCKHPTNYTLYFC